MTARVARPVKGGRLKRDSGTRDIPPKLVVVCEGKTEARILNELRSKWRIAQATVKLLSETGVPKTVVRTAKSERGPGTEVWVCFDRDEHPCWTSAIDQAQQLGLTLAISNPCIELFGLLLHQDQTGVIARDEAQSQLKAVHVGYDHSRKPYLNLDLVEANWPAALKRSEGLAKLANAHTDDTYPNPTTTFPLLIDRLYKLRPQPQ